MSNQASKPNLEIVHNQAAKRFETSIDGQTGYISYQESADKLVYDHTIVPQQLGGHLSRHTLANILSIKI